MSARLANEVRPCGVPMYCSACHNQDSSLTHVDFDAACDRGYGDNNVSMDDLILCEECLRRGAELVGMRDARELQDELTSLKRRLDQERYRADQADEYAGRLELAIDARPVAISAPRRRGRPAKEHDA